MSAKKGPKIIPSSPPFTGMGRASPVHLAIDSNLDKDGPSHVSELGSPDTTPANGGGTKNGSNGVRKNDATTPKHGGFPDVKYSYANTPKSSPMLATNDDKRARPRSGSADWSAQPQKERKKRRSLPLQHGNDAVAEMSRSSSFPSKLRPPPGSGPWSCSSP